EDLRPAAAEGDLLAAHENVAAFADELDTILAAAGADQLGAIGVGVGHLEIRVAVEAVGLLGRRRGRGLDRNRAALVHAQAPLSNIVVVGAPVGHLAAGVFIPPA